MNQQLSLTSWGVEESKTHTEEQTEWLKELKESITRYEELLEKGLDALSDYDKNIASSNPIDGLRTAFYLVGNHINYFEEKLINSGITITPYSNIRKVAFGEEDDNKIFYEENEEVEENGSDQNQSD